ncbi:PBS lyase HEAT-like repeat protein [Brachyspira pilosicoli B2904]|uniref:PBS lyase HEAT-like repeat protein n=1 Tax=Brachyspira pilosicoli B2904 TaxID=1133568 RepID=J9USN1_BRAPL|nr:HEAT repeat domain-containing protein [Brachyspira pilosicoli]AFR70299.1 PBS lyase HEAT-like repeat protein [Brachyspira pilosicoli B2904]
MFKKIFISTLVLVFSVATIFAQETTTDTTTTTTTQDSNNTTGTKPREELDQNFVDALINQDETLLINAIETGSPSVKALCFEALSKKGATSDLAIRTINRYVGYGLGTSGSNSDSDVRYQALQAAKIAKSETSVDYISQMLFAEQETFNIIAAVQALGEIGSEKAVPALLFQLRLGRTQGIVYEVAVALGKIGSPMALGDLIDLSQDDQYFLAIRQAAIDAIKNIKPAADNNNNTQQNTETTETTQQ